MTNLDGLHNFMSKLSKYDNYKVSDKVAMIVAEKGKELADESYSFGIATDGNRKTTYVEVTIEGSGSNLQVVAADNSKKPQIAYWEFGTGKYAQGKYEGKLPTQNITFEDGKGIEHSTNGWEYYYKNDKTKPDYPNKDYWIISTNGKIVSSGMQPQSTMYNVAKELRVDLSYIIDKLRG